MIEEEFKDLVFKFAREASLKEVAYIFLFGSVARGDTDRRSDVDLIVAFDTDLKDIDKLEVKDRISELTLYLEKEYDKNIQVLFTNKNFYGLDSYFIKEVMREGILLYAKSPKINVKGLKLEPYALMLYSLRNSDKKERAKLKRLLYGHKTRKKFKGKVYEYEKKGLVSKLDGKHIGAGAIVVPQKNVQALEKRLEEFKIQHKRVDMWLTEDDVIKIRA